MNAPDKIYIEIDGNRIHTYLGLQPENAVEYIHKNALLEWAEHMNGIYPAGAFQMMIDKIESL